MTTQSTQLSNVIDLRTREAIMPKKIRSILKGQYVESSDMEHDPDKFVDLLEQRLLSELARTTINFTKEWLNDHI